MDAAAEMNKRKLALVSQFMISEGVPLELRRRVSQFYLFSRFDNSDNDVLSTLPSILSIENMPNTLSEFFSHFSFLNLDILSATPASCWNHTLASYGSKLLFSTLLPIALLLGVALVHLVRGPVPASSSSPRAILNLSTRHLHAAVPLSTIQHVRVELLAPCQIYQQ